MTLKTAMKKLNGCTCLLWALVVGCPWYQTVRADDYWSGRRSRQRAELAELPKPSEPPAGNGSPIDRFVAADWTKDKFTPPTPVQDATFARRAYMDVVGLL